MGACDWLALAVFLPAGPAMPGFPSTADCGADGLIGTSQLYRLLWAYRMLERDIRVMDSTLIGNLVTSVSFYANTTIYIIAGLVAALGASDKLISFTADLPFGNAGNRELLEIKLMLVLASFVFAYFKFTWSLRQFNLLSILVGAAPMGKAGEPGIDAYAQRVAGANNLAGDDFNRGIRAYYFGLAASGWLLNPGLLGLLVGDRAGRALPPRLPLAGAARPARLRPMSRQAPLAGIAYGLTAYVIWGFFPLYFRQLAAIDADRHPLSPHHLGLCLRRPAAHAAPAAGPTSGRPVRDTPPPRPPGRLPRCCSAPTGWVSCGRSIIIRSSPPASATS
jgi:uncharacterized membrane protein